MASIANVTVKKADGTTDITYTAISGAPGEGMPAVWQNTTGSTIRGNRPSIAMQSKLNGTKLARRVDINGVFPIIRTVSGAETVIGKIPLGFTVPVPEWATDAEVAEAVCQFTNLLVSAHIRDHIKAGSSPT